MRRQGFSLPACASISREHARIALCSTRPPPTVPVTSPSAVTSILLPASCGVLPTASTSVTQTNGTPLCDSSASRSTNPCGVGMNGGELGARSRVSEFSVGGNAESSARYRHAIRSLPAIAGATRSAVDCRQAAQNFLARGRQHQLRPRRSGPRRRAHFFAAAHTAMPSISGGSPTALLRYTFRTLSLLSNVATLNTSGTSVIAGILYVVGEWDSRSPLRVVDERFGRDPAHPLDEPADDLPAIDARVDRPADIDQQIDPRHAQLAGEAVDEHLGHGGALRVIEERSSLARLAIEIDARRGVKAAGAQIDALAAGLGTELAERNSLIRPPAVEHMTVAELHVRRRRRRARPARRPVARPQIAAAAA